MASFTEMANPAQEFDRFTSEVESICDDAIDEARSQNKDGVGSAISELDELRKDTYEEIQRHSSTWPFEERNRAWRKTLDKINESQNKIFADADRFYQ